ncbi:MAG: thiol:disulfide interchange protein DsbA/DsbL [Candidatus Competibacter sp.]|nr:thiol:disulfide interchange protein DsbA/DsbL [Candidatus Competibacter sp.]MDG4584210.1 thiol:disulfide interchange protein DsbA/DsbL [Candidatus Competibacter sp.]
MPKLFRRLLPVMLACALPLVVAHAATPAAFQEGKDYIRLSSPVPTSAPDKIEVVELFWYGCPHCFDLEPVTREWLKRKPDNVVFVRIPVSFGANWEPGARAYYAAEALGVLDQIHQPLFDAIHREKRKLNTEDELAAFFAEHGVDRDAFRKAYNSFQTETQLRRGNQLAQRYGVRGVPAVIVNGKYDVRSPRMFEVVDFLIAQEAAVPEG